MKHLRLVHFWLALALVLITASSALAVFPDYRPGLKPTLGDGTATFALQRGWSDNIVTWYFCTDTSQARYAVTQQLTYAPRLLSALDSGARAMYVVTNFNNNGPVFSTNPIHAGDPTYSGLWEVRYVRWNPGYTPHIIMNASPESPGNPYGLPDPLSGAINITSVPNIDPLYDPYTTDTRTVVDCPIVAMGSLGSPNNNPRFGGVYRIQQVVALDSFSNPKTITLPTFSVYCNDNISQRLGVSNVIIPDVQDPGLAAILKANIAPGLGDVPFSDAQNFWVIDWQQKMANGGTLVVPPTQKPVVEECPSNFYWGNIPTPSPFSWQNTNAAYTPIGIYTLLQRHFDPVAFPGYTDKTVIATPTFIEILLNTDNPICDFNLLTVVFGDTKINAPQISLPATPAAGRR